MNSLNELKHLPDKNTIIPDLILTLWMWSSTIGWMVENYNQISRYEFVVLCPKAITHIEYNCQSLDVQSLLSAKILDIHAPSSNGRAFQL